MYALNRVSEHAIVGSGAKAPHAVRDRRSEPRFQTSQHAFMQTGFPDWTERRPVKVVDVSKNGIRITATVEIPPGSTIRIQFPDVFVFGEVRRCDRAGELFNIGIRIQDVFEVPRQ